ncbi:hypothetical protein GF336_04900 [Candidatus Woesearchaeota archaeon]|nr:hypothetical protein [Candidatus Woesearchaeota archaeon]
MVNFQDFIRTLEHMGIADVLLPFLLIFTIVFAVLQKSELLGEDKKNFNVVISLVIGLSVIIPHVIRPGGEADVIPIINQALPQISLIAVAFIMVLLLVGLFGVEWKGNSISGIFALISAIAVLVIFGGAAGWWEDPYWLYDIFGEETISVVIMILVFGLIIWFITSEKKEGGKALTDSIKGLGDYFAGK